VLEGIGAALAGRRFALRSGRQTIGRGSDNDIVIDDASVSSSHAWIINQHGRHVIMNTLSTNGTFVNDRRVHETALRHGDRVRLGQAEFVFLTREHDAADGRRRRLLVAATLLLVTLAGLAWWLLGLHAA
jgi:pSer/pThr/pTyr-binding forkhead associated (FHA) protein